MKREYSKGYIPKIQYWTEKLLKASTPLEQAAALSKVRYFQGRHKEVYGEVVTMDGLVVTNVIAGVDFTESLQMLESL